MVFFDGPVVVLRRTEAEGVHRLGEELSQTFVIWLGIKTIGENFFSKVQEAKCRRVFFAATTEVFWRHSHFGFLDDFEFVSKSIVTGTLELLKYVLNTKARLIYSASSSKFGNNGKDENLSPYSFFKSKNVELIKNLGDWFNLEYSICYFFNVYGRNHIKTGNYATVIAIFEEQFKNKETLTVVSPGTQSRDFTHIDDICSGLIKATEKNIRAEYHLRFGENFQIIDVAKTFSEKITYIKERRGERFTSEFFASDTNETLNWYPTINLIDYINDFKKNSK